MKTGNCNFSYHLELVQLVVEVQLVGLVLEPMVEVQIVGKIMGKIVG